MAFDLSREIKLNIRRRKYKGSGDVNAAGSFVCTAE